MNQRRAIAQKANIAAEAIGDAMVKAIGDTRPRIVNSYDLDEHLMTLAIAKAAIVIAADAASQATGMLPEQCNELEDRLHSVVSDAMHFQGDDLPN